MYLYDYSNGLIEVGSGSAEVGFWVQDFYTVEYECPLCSGGGTVWGTEAESDEEYEITCPHCNGSGNCEDEIYIDVDEYVTVEVEGKRVGAYGDENLYYSNGRVEDTAKDSAVYETIQRMVERQKEERQASLTDEERKAVELEKKIKQELEKLMAEYQQLKTEVERILEG